MIQATRELIISGGPVEYDVGDDIKVYNILLGTYVSALVFKSYEKNSGTTAAAKKEYRTSMQSVIKIVDGNRLKVKREDALPVEVLNHVESTLSFGL